jgi:hypothetical protein
MTKRRPRIALLATTIGLILGTSPRAVAGDEKALIGSYSLATRVMTDGTRLTGPDILGIMTFTKTRRTVIMKWPRPGAEPVSIALIASFTLSGGRYCESVAYGANGNLGAPGVTYDAPSTTPACSRAISDASGLSFDVPGENLRLRVTRDGIITSTAKWTDYWEKVK